MTFDATRSVPEADRQFYAREYARPGHMKAGVEVFRAFPTDAKDFAEFAQTKLSMPLLVLSGERPAGRSSSSRARSSFPIDRFALGLAESLASHGPRSVCVLPIKCSAWRVAIVSQATYV